MTIITAIYIALQKIHNQFQLRKLKKKGRNNNVYGKITIINPKNLIVGDNCSFNHYSYINAFCPIELGNDVSVSAGAKIISTGIDYISWANGKKQHIINGGINIGDHVWIGANAQILPGVKISGKYVVIAAGAVVNKNIYENRCIVGGCPAKIIKRF